MASEVSDDLLPGRDRPPAPGGYSFRRLRPADLDGIGRVHWRACRVAYRFMGWSYTEDECRRWYAGKLADWDWGRVACTADGAVVAFVAMTGAHIDQVFVDPGHQGVGLGRTLLAAALARGLRPATLDVLARNRPARRLYEAFGFRQVDGWWDEPDGARKDGAIVLFYQLD